MTVAFAGGEIFAAYRTILVDLIPGTGFCADTLILAGLGLLLGMAGPADIGAGSSLCGRSIAALTVVFVAAVQHLLHTAAVLAAPVGAFRRFPPLCASRSGRIVRSAILRAAVLRMHMNAVFRQPITVCR